MSRRSCLASGACSILIFLGIGLSVRAQPEAGRTFAFLVACGDYDRTQLKPVPFTVPEMKLFRDVLVDSGVPEPNIVFLHDKTDEPRRYLPTRKNIVKECALLMERLRPSDSVVVALSGHGVQFHGDKFGYFCPLDAELTKKETLLPMEGDDGLLTLLDQGKAGRKFLIVNACRNKPTSTANLAAERLQLRDEYNEEAPKGTVMLLACRQNQLSWFYPETEKRAERRNRSLFMYHLVEAWKGSYAKGKRVTVDHVLEQVTDRVEADATVDFSRNQIPIVKRKFEGQWDVGSVELPDVEPKVHSGLAYAEPRNDKQVLDVYVPPSGTNLPVAIWIHGGGWRAGDKLPMHHKPKAFVQRGYILVSINYRLYPQVTLNQIPGDVAKAIRWTYDHAREYGGDPNKLVVLGHSAGSQLSALVCTDERYLKAENLTLANIKACVPVDCDTLDIPLQIRTVEEKRAKIYRALFREEENQRRLSPISHVGGGKNIPPFFCPYVADHPETTLQTLRFMKTLREAGIDAKAHAAEGKNHTTINQDLGLSSDRTTLEMFAFLRAALRK